MDIKLLVFLSLSLYFSFIHPIHLSLSLSILHRAVKIPQNRDLNQRSALWSIWKYVSFSPHVALRKCVTNRTEKTHIHMQIFPKYDILFLLYWAYDNLLFLLLWSLFALCTMCVCVCARVAQLPISVDCVRREEERFPRALLHNYSQPRRPFVIWMFQRLFYY